MEVHLQGKLFFRNFLISGFSLLLLGLLLINFQVYQSHHKNCVVDVRWRCRLLCTMVQCHRALTASVIQQVQQLFYRLLCLCLSSSAALVPLGSGTGIPKPDTQCELKSLKKYIKDFLLYEFSDITGVQKSRIICFVVAWGSQFFGENFKKLIIYT